MATVALPWEPQTVNRGELLGVIVILELVTPVPGATTRIWSDSKYVVGGVRVVLKYGAVGFNADLWHRFLGEYHRHAGAVEVLKAPAHRQLAAAVKGE
eukprot:1210839-Lingulodinium_polyedra.AAC.1